MSEKDRALGDHPTPARLAAAVLDRVASLLPRPASIVEPSCGDGALLAQALVTFPDAIALGVEIQSEHVLAARARPELATAQVIEADAFVIDWDELLAPLVEPILILANPPWITRSALGVLRGSSSPRALLDREDEISPIESATDQPPRRKNKRTRGLEALTGKSNFDVTEWQALRLLRALTHRRGALALLCKSSTARRILADQWRTGAAMQNARWFPIDARRDFGVVASAGLLIAEIGGAAEMRCAVHAPISKIVRDAPLVPRSIMGWRDGSIVPDIEARDRSVADIGRSSIRWRSGVKHDCAAVMELTRRDGALWNGLGERVEIEPSQLYPLRKCTDLARDRDPGRWLVITQRSISDDTALLEQSAPATWAYLVTHADRLDARASRIYDKRSRFSIFGVGEYSFAPWKVALSALHKEPTFRVVGPVSGQPVLFDDTCCFLPFTNERDARRTAAALDTPLARDALKSLVFVDAKRPYTVEVLDQLGKLVEQALVTSAQ